MNSNYSEVLRLRSHALYAKADPQTTAGRQASPSSVAHNWLQMSRDFQPILRSNSSLSLDQKRANNHNNFLNSASIDFKDFQELRECRSSAPHSAHSAPKQSAKASSKTVAAKKSRTIGSIQSLSV